MPPVSAFTRYTSSFIGATLLTSFAFRSLLHRRASTAERDRLTAHTTILESLVGRMRAGEDVPEGEIVRLLRLARGEGDEGSREGGSMKDTPWREVVFGKKVKEDEALEVAKREWESAVAQDLSTPKAAAPPTLSPLKLASVMRRQLTVALGFFMTFRLKL